MPRSVVKKGASRCGGCHYPPRWCICAGFRPLTCPFELDVLIHERESARPTSTGRLINRVFPASRGHVFQHDFSLSRAAIVRPNRVLWILHPHGEPLPAGGPPDDLQVLLLDGSWREVTRMMHGAENWGRTINLPMTGPSRYLLRDHQGAGQYSTIEALLFLLDAFGLTKEHAHLRLQFDLHVYAGLRARGRQAAAEEFLEDSPARTVFPELVQRLAYGRARSGWGAS